MSTEVTVVVPTKDRPESLSRTLRSIVAQRYVSVSIVLVDDGSAPAAAAAIEVQATAAGALLVRHETPRGVSAARNAGLALAHTHWVAFVDDDDLWAPGKLARQLAAAAAHPRAAWVSSSAVHFDDFGVLHVHRAPLAGDLLPGMLSGNLVPGGGSGVLARTVLLRSLGGFDESLSTLADRDCWIRLAEAAPMASVDLPDVGYRVHATSMAHDTPRAEAELALVRHKHRRLHEALGVELDDARWTDYLQGMAYRSGDTATGTRLSMRLVLRHRQMRGLVQPVVALSPPAVRRVTRRRRVRQLDPVLLNHALAWLKAEERPPTVPVVTPTLTWT